MASSVTSNVPLREVRGRGGGMLQICPTVEDIRHGEEDRLGRDAAYRVAHGQLRIAPAYAAVTEVTIPEREVLAPSSTAPTIASPRPVRSASASATPVNRVPASRIASAATTNRTTDSVRDAPLRSGKRVHGRESHFTPRNEHQRSVP